MRLCFVNDDFSLGGQQKAIMDAAKILGSTNEVFLYSFFNRKVEQNIGNIDFYKLSSNVDMKFHNKVFRRINRKILPNMLKYTTAYEYKRRVSELVLFLKNNKIDIVILSGGLMISFTNYLKQVLPELKFFCWIHSSAEVYFDQYCKDILIDFKSGIEVADTIICLTEHDKKILEVFNKNTVVIPNPISIDENSNVSISTLEKKNILFVGRIDVNTKGLDYLVYLSKSLPEDWTITVVGSGDRKQEKIFLELLDKVEHNNIIWIGKKVGRDLAQAYRNSSILISVSRWEGFGLVILEAMSFGLPIIAFDNEGPKSILDGGKYGVLIEKYDLDKFEISLKKMISSLEVRENYQKLSLDRVKDFSSDKIYSQWKKIIY